MKNLLKKLIDAKPTLENGEAGAANALADYFTAHKIDSVVDTWDTNRANFIAHIKSTGRKPALMFVSHLDVVPASEENWKLPPFKAVEKDGIIYGRGAADMKAGLTAAAAAVTEIVNSQTTLKGDIIFAATAGELYLIEVGGYGADAGEGFITIRCEGEVEPPESQYDCANALPIGDVTDMPFDTTDAAFDGPGLCMTSPNIWFCYATELTGNVTVSLLGSAYDTKLAVYEGCECYPTMDNLIECNDDFDGTYQSQVTFATTAGYQYLIEIGGYASESGQGILNINGRER